MEIARIVREAGVSPSPGYYGGRGATASDLDDRRLEAIHGLVSRHRGAEQAKAPVEVVAGMRCLSASEFLVAVPRLDGNGWDARDALSGEEGGLRYGNGREALGTAAQVLGGGRPRSARRDRQDPPDLPAPPRRDAEARRGRGTLRAGRRG